MLRSRRLWIGLAVSLVFIALFFRQTDFQGMWQALAGANYLYVIPALAVYLLAVWFRAVRWQYLLRPLRSVSAGTLYPVVVIGYMTNNLLPARLGELVRAYLVGERERVSKTAALGTIVVERLCDGLVLLAFLLVVALFTGISGYLRELAVVMAVLFGVGLLVLLALTTSTTGGARMAAIIIGLLPERYRARLLGLALSFLSGLGSLRSPTVVAVVLTSSAASWLLEATMYALIGRAFALDLGFHVYLLVAAAANLAISVPSSQGGIGPFEFFAKETVVFFGAGAAVAQAYAIALHAVLLLSMIVLGLVFLWAINLSFGEVVEQVKRGAALQTSRGPGEA